MHNALVIGFPEVGDPGAYVVRKLWGLQFMNVTVTAGQHSQVNPPRLSRVCCLSKILGTLDLLEKIPQEFPNQPRFHPPQGSQ